VNRFVRSDMPPASAMPRGDPERCAADSATLQLPIHRSVSLPTLQHEHPRSAVEPLIHVGEHPRRVGQAEVRLSPSQIAPQFSDHP
jgi:hypothetical protein